MRSKLVYILKPYYLELCNKLFQSIACPILYDGGTMRRWHPGMYWLYSLYSVSENSERTNFTNGKGISLKDLTSALYK